MSIFSAVIFLALFISHIIKNKTILNNKCKFGFPCFFFISSYNENESLAISISYGVWFIFYVICTISYYFIISSEQEEQEIYFENNRNLIATSYLVSSWNFNYRSEIESKKTKNAIHGELKNYADDFVKKLEGIKEKKCRPLPNTLTHILYVIFVIVYIFIFFIIYYLRDMIRQKNINKIKLSMMDILADIITYLLLAVIMHLFIGISGLFPKIEGWKMERSKNISEGVKKIIISFIGIIIILFFQSFYTLLDNNKAILPFLKAESYSFFGCPGKYIDARRNSSLYTNILSTNYQLTSPGSFAKCRDEELGIDFFFIFLIYYIFFYLDELLKCAFRCCYDVAPSFSPIMSLIDFFSMLILYIVAVFFFPFLGIIFPGIIVLAYKFQFILLKRHGSYSFQETGMTKRNNNHFVLVTYILFNIVLILSFGYFYLISFPHFYNVTCYSSKDLSSETILLYDKSNWCGPVKTRIRYSEILTDKIVDTVFIGWILKLFQEAPFIMALISLIFIILIYRKYNPDKRYYEFLVKRQLELAKTFHIFYDQISKRDILTSMLLKVTKQKDY